MTILINIVWEEQRRPDPTYKFVSQYLLVKLIVTATKDYGLLLSSCFTY